MKKRFVFFIRNQDLHKIGITYNLLRRFNQIDPDEVLNIVRCSNYESLENELHKNLRQIEFLKLNISDYIKNNLNK